MVWFIKKRKKRRERDRFIKKKLNKKIRERPRFDVVSRTSKKVKKKIILISIISLCIAGIVLWIIGRQAFFYGSSQRIRSVTFTQETTQRHRDQELFDTIAEDLIWTSWRANRRFGIDNALRERSHKYPLVDNAILESFAWWELTISLSWKEPTLLFRVPWGRLYASYDENIIQVNPELGIASSTYIIDLPRYTETFEDIDWIFWQLSESQLHEYIESVRSSVWADTISEYIYLPWGKKLFLGHDSRRWYFHLNKDLQTQLDKLFTVKEFYSEYNTISIIDLWSTDNVIVR